MHVLMTGASGFVGRHLVRHLRDSGHRVTALGRGRLPADAGAVFAGPERLADIDMWPGWPDGIEAVVHLAAANPARGEAGAGDEAWLRTVNVEGTAALARRCAREGVGRVVFLSSANVHSPRADGRPITEDDPLAPQNAYAASKAEAEAALAAALAGTATRAVVLRPAPVFGEGGRGTVARLARIARTPLPLPLGGLGGRRSLIAVEDLCRAIERAVVADGLFSRPLLISGGSATPAEIVRALRQGRGQAPRLLPAPLRLAGLLALASGRQEAWNALAADFVLDTARAHRVLDWSPGAALLDRLRDSAE